MARVREQGLAAGARSLTRSAAERLLERGRTVVLLEVDLADPSHGMRERDRAHFAEQNLRLADFDRAALPRVLSMLEREAPERLPSVRARVLQGVSGLVFEKSGEVIGYVFWVHGSDEPGALGHRDLEWLGLRPAGDQVYVFDYFVPESARGQTSLLVRAVQSEHAALGFRAAYGYVYLSNRPALWTYRTTGWKEIGRLEEQRILTKVAVVGGALYWMHPWWRTKISARRLFRS